MMSSNMAAKELTRSTIFHMEIMHLKFIANHLSLSMKCVNEMKCIRT